MAVTYAQQAPYHDLEMAETKIKKPQSYGDDGGYGGGYGGDSYGSHGGTVNDFIFNYRISFNSN